MTIITDKPYLDALQTGLTYLNTNQWQAVTAPRQVGLTVLAGAGTGKTEVIAARFLWLAAQLAAEGISNPSEHILLVTFTEKAAKEMAERIHAMAKRFGIAGLLKTLDDTPLWIHTFHGACQRILQTSGHFLGLVSNFQVADRYRQQQLWQQLLTQLKNGTLPHLTPILNQAGLQNFPADRLSLNQLQRLEGESLLSLIESLPSLIQRIKATGQSPSEFYQQATQLNHQFHEALLTLPSIDPISQDPLSSRAMMASAWSKHLAPWAHPTWVSHCQEVNLEDLAYDDWIEGLRTSGCLTQYNRSLKGFEALYRDPNLFAAQHQLNHTWLTITTAFYALYQHTLAENNTLDFDDLINESLRLFNTYPACKAPYQQAFQAILVDEFQDSNGAQLHLLQQLMQAPLPNVTVVGDIKQSIYGFRHAQPQNLEQLFNAYPSEHCTTFALTSNYRSHPDILEAANAHTQTMLPKTLWDQHLLISGKTLSENTLPKKVGLTQYPSEILNAEKPDEKPTKIPIDANKRKEAANLVTTIQQLVTAGEYAYAQIAILARNHKKLTLIEETLFEAGIPTVREKSPSFFEQSVIKDAMALLQLSLDWQAEMAWLRLLQSRLNDAQLYALIQLKPTFQSSFIDTLTNALMQQQLPETIFPEVVQSALTQLIETLRQYRAESANLKPAQLFCQLSSAVGLIHPSDLPELQTRQQEQLQRLYRLLRSLESQTLASSGVEMTNAAALENILTYLEAYQQDPSLDLTLDDMLEEAPQNAVRLLTAHSAKGLEFPVVLIAWVESPQAGMSNLPPFIYDPGDNHRRGMGFMVKSNASVGTLQREVYRLAYHKPTQQAEGGRLYYVALTRAKAYLSIHQLQSRDDAPYLFG